MRAYRDSVDRDAIALKDSDAAVDQLCGYYKNLNDPERTLANAVLGEWILDSDDRLRFDALALVDEFQMRSAIEPLQRLAERLTASKEASAPYELNQVNRLLSSLAS
jgi:hypothetical protein